MRRLSLVAGFLPAALLAQAPRAAAPKYVTNPSTWKLEVKQLPGGWTTQRRIEAEFKLVDPTDPDPPKPGSNRYYDPEVEDQAERPQNKWPERPSVKLLYWFNGERREVDATVGYATSVSFEGQNGENRLEVRLPGSGQHAVRTWFTLTTRDRLLIRLSEMAEGGEDRGWWGGGLQVVEPDHTESIGYEPTPSGGKNRGDSYVHPSPLPGTYTVRWFDGSQGVDGYEWGGDYYGGNRKPKKVRVEVVLDPGTEQERRWSFERLVIPGTRRVTLGSFDVEG